MPPEENGSILSLSVQPSPTGVVAYVELAMYGLTDAEAAGIEGKWAAVWAPGTDG